MITQKSLKSIESDPIDPEQVVLGNITIDAQKAPASMNPAELNIYQPKHYAQLQEYMEKVKPLIDSLTPPWESEQQSRSMGSDSIDL